MDILFFAVVAVFIAFKLREQLGKVDEEKKRDSIRQFIKEQTKIQNPNQQNNQSNQYNSFRNIPIVPEADESEQSNYFHIDEKSQKILDKLNPNLRSDLESVLQSARITPFLFLQGARSAFEIIINAFSKADLQALQPLLSEKMFSQFKKIIEERKSHNQTLNTKLISIDETEITFAKLKENMGEKLAQIEIVFKTKQVSFIEDSTNQVINGNKTEINTVIDNWTFKKDCNSQSPIWLLYSTK